ncbi:uncharacterized protein TrAtP1_007311 [Trichoderma atroviride]|uniref:uncharacterized protein n=1 Tax=Hypocrea atroviridis TaxID=63577 RepID=UPI00332071CD|nr:hypothetical protein TrAtP1_007311 [Trichoderma atroviride]
MPADKDTLYSQGVNFDSFIQDGVDPRTGQYTCSIDVYNTPAETRNCTPLKLSLGYNPLKPENIGLGKGWSFNLSSYHHRVSKTLSLSTGEHYKVKERGNNVSVRDQKLKSFHFSKKGHDEYKVVYKGGQVEILSNLNNMYKVTVPVELRAVNGRSLKLIWTRSNEQPRLSKIQEDSQYLVEFRYADHQVEITRAPGTKEASTFTLILKDNRLVQLQLPLQHGDSQAWKFRYEDFGQFTCLSGVTSPLGLVEEVEHRADGHLLPHGAPYQAIPYVVSHISKPMNQQPPIKTIFKYSAENFLGYRSNFDWTQDEDNLYHARQEYEYSSTVQVVGGARTKYIYNKFHLILRTERQQGAKMVTQTTTYYAMSVPFELQPPQYQLPKSVRTEYLDKASKGLLSRSEICNYVFDEWGNPTQTIDMNNITIDWSYYPAAETRDSDTGKVLCPADPHGFQRYMRSETITPAASLHETKIRYKRYTYLELPSAADAGYFVVVKQLECLEESRCFSSVCYAYVNQPEMRDHGRLQQEIIHLSGQKSITHDLIYCYPNPDQLTTIVTARGFDEHVIEAKTTSSLSSGLTLSKTDEEKVETQFQYDEIGRLVKATISPKTLYETTRAYEYSLRKDSTGCILTITDANGIKTRYTTDGLQRVVLVEQQDYNSQSKGDSYSEKFRDVQRHAYNTLGQRVKTIDFDWLKNEENPTEQIQCLEYDDWGGVCKVTKGNGVVVLSLTNPIDLTHTVGIEGQGLTKTYSNAFGSPLRLERLKADGTAFSKVTYDYDGLGRRVTHKDSLDQETRYLYDSFDRIVKIIRPDDHTTESQYAAHSAALSPELIKACGKTVGEQELDGLGRITSLTVGTRTTTKTYEGSAPKPCKITMPDGNTRGFTYDPQLHYALKEQRSTDGVDVYDHDKRTTATVKLQNRFGTEIRQYLPSGLLEKESYKTNQHKIFSANHVYSMAGKFQSYRDVHGQLHDLQYDDTGRPQLLDQGKVKVAFKYDTADRLCETCVEDKETKESLTTHQRYDDFSREIERNIYHGANKLYKIRQTFNLMDLITQRQTWDGNGTMLRKEIFQYDNHNRLVNYSCDGTQLPVDEKGHAIQEQCFTFDHFDNLVQTSTTFQDQTKNVTLYTYNSADPNQLIELTNTNSSYTDKIELEYNKNGFLTRDEQGRELRYDGQDRLSAVIDANDQILSEYQYDASGRLACQVVHGRPTYLHYRGDALIATTGDFKISYISDGKTYWGTLRHEGSENSQTQIWASDANQSILAEVDMLRPDNVRHQQYTPYGCNGAASSAITSIGFNGQWRDPVTGWYHLGNGYRVYNPVLMRFHSPDSWSPFISGEINTYAYCLSDPINRIDPSGHLSMSERDWTVMGVGIITGLSVGLLTAGAGFAIAAGVGIATGVASAVIVGIGYDLSTGKAPTAKSIGTDALYGFIGGVTGGLAGRALAVGIKSLPGSMARLLIGAKKLQNAGGSPGRGLYLDVGDIHFSQSSVSSKFKEHKLLLENILGIRNTNSVKTKSRAYPTINVTWGSIGGDKAALHRHKGSQLIPVMNVSGTYNQAWKFSVTLLQ